MGNGVDGQALTITGVAVSGDVELQVIERAGSQRSLGRPRGAPVGAAAGGQLRGEPADATSGAGDDDLLAAGYFKASVGEG